MNTQDKLKLTLLEGSLLENSLRLSAVILDDTNQTELTRSLAKNIYDLIGDITKIKLEKTEIEGDL